MTEDQTNADATTNTDEVVGLVGVGVQVDDLGTADEPQEAGEGDLDLTPEEWATAAAELATEAAEAQDGTADDDEPDTAFVDAFAPNLVEPENVEPEISPRDQRYREQLRDAEADRDRLSGLVESMRRSEVERQAAGRLADAADLFHGGATVADMLDDSGAVDPAKVDSAITGLLEKHAHWATPRARYDGPLQSGATSVPLEPQGKKWSDAFAPNDEEA
jgi:hypothetical protein